MPAPPPPSVPTPKGCNHVRLENEEPLRVGGAFLYLLMLKEILKLLVAKAVPAQCLSCNLPGTYLCADCQGYLPYLEQTLCPVCTRAAVDGFTHPRCRSRYAPDRLFVPFRYYGVMGAAVRKLKYRAVTALADFLAGLLVEEMLESGFEFGRGALLVPVPLHPVKQLERGYNQSEILARSLGRMLKVELANGALKRIRETPSQTKLKGKEREKNVRGAFGVNQKKGILFRGKDIILVDDVFTTGATLRECNRVLKRAGARFIYLLAVAKD